ncbi:MAG TPA: hypothetical protein VMY34_05800, partial [Acidimicrobiales bacterium]|nr:hypothetical protein [Acidimicrobiales bacterium]
MPARIAAVVAALAMVVGALAFRNRQDAGEVADSQPLALVCTPEVEAICEELAKAERPRLEVTIEAAGITHERLASGQLEPADLDGWLSPGPWPGIVDDPQVRRSRPPRFRKDATLGFTTTIALVRTDRVAPLTARCGQVTWSCVADVAGRPWSEVSPGAAGFVTPAHEPANTDAGGLAVFSSVVTSFAAGAEFSAAEINDDFAPRITTFERAIPTGAAAADLVRGFVVRPSQFDIVGALAVDVSRDALAAATRIEPVAIQPVVRVPLVFASSGGRDGERLLERMRSPGATRVIR